MVLFLILISIRLMLVVLHSINAITFGIATVLNFNVVGLLLTIMFVFFGCRELCISVDRIRMLKNSLK